MIRVPAKYKKSISTELKKFIPVINSLIQKGKSSSEEDARIILNDILADVLNYDKYNELKTEHKDKNHKLDYAVKIQSNNTKKKDKIDFIIEAKAAHVELSQAHIDQTLDYCLSLGVDYFILTNVVSWHLFEVQKRKSKPEAIPLHSINFSKDSDTEILAEGFYPFSKVSYLEGEWNTLSDHKKATASSDIVAILLSDKVVKNVCKILKEIHDIKVSEDALIDVLEDEIIRESAFKSVNKNLLKKLNTVEDKKTKETTEQSTVIDNVVPISAAAAHPSNIDIPPALPPGTLKTGS